MHSLVDQNDNPSDWAATPGCGRLQFPPAHFSPGDLGVKKVQDADFCKARRELGGPDDRRRAGRVFKMAAENAWVHVQLSGMSRGWIRRAQLEMPSGFVPAAGTVSENPAGGCAMFKVAKEETRSFSGSWSPLRKARPN